MILYAFIIFALLAVCFIIFNFYRKNANRFDPTPENESVAPEISSSQDNNPTTKNLEETAPNTTNNFESNSSPIPTDAPNKNPKIEIIDVDKL